MKKSFFILLAFVIAAIYISATAQTRKKSTPQSKSITVGVSNEKVGSTPTSFLPIVGNWAVVDDGGKKVVMVDGREWKRGQPAGGLADSARAIYGSKHEEFIDNVKAFAYFPYSVAKQIDDFRDGE